VSQELVPADGGSPLGFVPGLAQLSVGCPRDAPVLHFPDARLTLTTTTLPRMGRPSLGDVEFQRLFGLHPISLRNWACAFEPWLSRSAAA